MRAQVHVVSLPDADQRRDAFAAQPHAGLVPWSFHDAHTRLQDPLRVVEREAVVHTGRLLTRGELGCYSSHHALWRRLLDDPDHDAYLVLEDDVVVDWPLVRDLLALDLREFDIDYLRLYQKRPSSFVVRRRPVVCRDYAIVELFGRPYGTQAYLLTRATAQVFASTTLVTRPVDDFMDRWWDHGVPNFALFPSPVMERHNVSGIGDDRYGHESTAEHLAWARRDEWRRRWAFASRRLRTSERLRQLRQRLGDGR